MIIEHIGASVHGYSSFPFDGQRTVPCLDTEEQAKKIIMKYSKCRSISEFEILPTDLKEKYIKKFHANGVSIRQISRLCGETKGLVEKYLR